MIGRLRGTLLEKQPPLLLMDVGGVGYEVQASLSTFFGLPEIGAEVVLHTQLIIRDDAHLLFGFGSSGERELFRSLIRVTGVGPKVALAILSGMSPGEFVGAIQRNDISTLVKLPGIGKKTAERLLVEMRDRVGSLVLTEVGTSLTAVPPAAGNAVQEAESALIALGYKPQDAARMIGAVAQEAEGAGSEELIRAALRSLSSR